MATAVLKKRLLTVFPALILFLGLAVCSPANIFGGSTVLIIDVGLSATLEDLLNEALPGGPASGYTSIKLTGGRGFKIESLGEPGDDESRYYNGDILNTMLPSLTLVDFSEFEGDLGEFTLASCENVETVILRRGIALPEGMFYGCYSLKTVGETAGLVDLSGCTALGADAFNSCVGISRVKLPLAAEIPEAFFASCAALKTVGDFDGVVDLSACASLGNQAFLNCRSIIKVLIPEGLNMPARLFEGCLSLKTIGAADNIIDLSGCLSFKSSAFKGCVGLTNVILPPAVAIPESMFEKALSLTTIGSTANVVDLSANTSIGKKAFMNCPSITKLILAPSASIGVLSFAECGSLATVGNYDGIADLQACVDYGTLAFNSCPVQGLVLSPLTDIGEEAFCDMAGLEFVLINGAKPFIHPDAFGGTGALTILSAEKFADLSGFPEGSAYPEINIGQYSLPAEGSRVTLALSRSIPGVTFQWERNEELIFGEAQSTYSINEYSHGANGGAYSCLINAAGISFRSDKYYLLKEISPAGLGIAAPVKGAAPQKSLGSLEGEFAGSISWSPAHDNFLASTVYTAAVELTAKAGHGFSASYSPSVAGAEVGALEISPDGSKASFKLTYGATAAKAPESIKISAQPNKLSYRSGEILDLEGLVLTLIYDDKTEEVVSPEAYTIDGVGVTPLLTVLSTVHSGKAVILKYGELTVGTNPLTVNALETGSLLISLTSPAGAVINDREICAVAASDEDRIAVEAKVSPGASWRLYSDPECENEIEGKSISLQEGENTAYIKVTSEDKSSSTVYTFLISRKPAAFKLEIENGAVTENWAALYKAGSKIQIKADAPVGGKVFYKWESSGGSFENINSSETVFTMPGENTLVRALYQDTAPAVLNSGGQGVSIIGNFTLGAKLLVNKGAEALHSGGSCGVCDDVRQKDSAELFGLYDISVIGGYSGRLTVSFDVGADKNGKSFIVVHCDNGVHDERILVAENGRLSGEFNSLSPFALILRQEVTVSGDSAAMEQEQNQATVPQTGDEACLGLWVFLLSASILAFSLGIRRKIKGCAANGRR